MIMVYVSKHQNLLDLLSVSDTFSTKYTYYWLFAINILVTIPAIMVDSSNTDLNPIAIQALLRSVFGESTIV